MSKTEKPNLSAIAKRFQVTVRTARRWAAEAAPVDDDAALGEWLAGRRSNGAEPPAAECPPRPAPTAATESQAPVGAAAALRRLETEEAIAHRAMQAAMAAGSPAAQKASRRHWLELAGELRRADAALDAARRDAAELIPREELERIAHALGYCLRLAVGRHFPPDERRDATLLHSFAGLAATMVPAMNCAPWAVAAVRRGYLGEWSDERLDQWFCTLGKVMVHFGEAATEPEDRHE